MTRTLLALSAVILAFGIAAPASAQDDPAVVMQFGALHPQPAPPANNVLVPDEVTINKGGTVLFIMNGGGHRVNIYPVSKQTVRADIEEDLCQGGPGGICVGGATANLRYVITDAKGDVIIDTQTNVEQPFISHQHDLMLSVGGPAVLTGTVPPVVPPAVQPNGHQVQYRFEKTGRYLVICGTRPHSLNDYMFGFVNVVGDADH